MRTYRAHPVAIAHPAVHGLTLVLAQAQAQAQALALALALVHRVPIVRHAAIGLRKPGQTTVGRDHRALNLATAHRARTCKGRATAHHGRRGRQVSREAHGLIASNALIALIVPTALIVPSQRSSVPSPNALRRPMRRPLRPRWRSPPNKLPTTKPGAAAPRCCGLLNRPPSRRPTSAP